MIRSSLFAMTIAATAMLATPAVAQVFNATLSGANEVPAANTPGFGSGVVTLDTVANTMRVQTTFAALIGNTTAAHIHCCAAPGTSVGVATVTPSFTGFPLGVTSGAYDFTYDMTLAGSFNASFITANGGTVTTARNALFNGIINGQSYLNIHSTRFPGGEIRGQLTAAPEPGTWAMMLIGFAGVGLAMRRRRTVVMVKPT